MNGKFCVLKISFNNQYHKKKLHTRKCKNGNKKDAVDGRLAKH